MAKQLLSYSFRIDVVLGGAKKIMFCSGQANDSVLTNYTSGVSCAGMPRSLTVGELDGTLQEFIDAHTANLQSGM